MAGKVALSALFVFAWLAVLPFAAFPPGAGEGVGVGSGEDAGFGSATYGGGISGPAGWVERMGASDGCAEGAEDACDAAGVSVGTGGTVEGFGRAGSAGAGEGIASAAGTGCSGVAGVPGVFPPG